MDRPPPYPYGERTPTGVPNMGITSPLTRATSIRGEADSPAEQTSSPLIFRYGTASNAVPLVAETLYNLYFVINNVTDRYQVFLQNNSIASISAGPTQLFATSSDPEHPR